MFACLRRVSSVPESGQGSHDLSDVNVTDGGVLSGDNTSEANSRGRNGETHLDGYLLVRKVGVYGSGLLTICSCWRKE